jgi:AcrR family transcriptional regulator
VTRWSERLPAAERRRQLLDVAHDAFAEHGFHRTSMGEIAEAAGVTKPVLYQHWISKRALYLELLEDVGAQLMDAITAATAAATGPRLQVEAGFAAYFGWVAANTSSFRLLFGSGARRDDEFAVAVRRVEESIAGVIALLIEADIDDEHRRQLAFAVVGLAEGVSRSVVSGLEGDGEGAAHPPAFDANVLARRMAQLAWAGLRGIHRD